jgi:hypothetical protein
MVVKFSVGSNHQKANAKIVPSDFLNVINSRVIASSSWIFYPVIIFIFSIMNILPFIKNQLLVNYSTNILAGESLPKPVNFTSSNLLPAVVYRIFGINSDDYYGQASPKLFVFLLVLLTLATYFIFLLGISKLESRKERRFLTLILVLSPMHQFLALPFDMYDVFIYLGISLIIYGIMTQNHLNLFFVGSFLFAFSHPEQALASFAALFLLSLNMNFRFLRKMTIQSLLFTITVNFGVHVWYYLFDYRDARAIEIIFGFFPITLPGHISHPYDSFETIVKMYGLLWILVFISLKILPGLKIDHFFFTISTIGAPFFFWFVTSDGLRCVVPMTTLLSFVLAVTLSTKKKEFYDTQRLNNF